MKKNSVDDPYYSILRERYLIAQSTVHFFETIQYQNRILLKVATEEVQRQMLRRAMYRERKTLAKLNNDIAKFYAYLDRYNLDY